MWSLWTKTGRDHRINVHDLLKWWDSNHVCCYFMICMTNFLKEYLLQITEEAYRNISTLNPWSKGPTYKEPLEWGIEVVGYKANPGFVGPEGYIICWYLLRKNIKTTENPIQMRTPLTFLALRQIILRQLWRWDLEDWRRWNEEKL